MRPETAIQYEANISINRLQNTALDSLCRVVHLS